MCVVLCTFVYILDEHKGVLWIQWMYIRESIFICLHICACVFKCYLSMSEFSALKIITVSFP